MKPGKKVLVTGANGYIGSYVVHELKKRGFYVVGFTYSNARVKRKTCADKVVEGDLLDKQSLDKAVADVDAVIHLAACVRTPDPKLNFEINVNGSQNLIDACTKHNVRRVIFTSTGGVLNKIRGPYGESKLRAEKLFDESRLDYTIFRPTLVYGPESRGINNIIKFILLFPFFIPLVGNGNGVRQPVSVQDTAIALVDAIGNKKTYRKTYPLAGKESILFKDFVDVISREMGVRKVKISFPVWICYLTARIMEKALPNPPVTSENVRSLSQSTKTDVSQLVMDTNFSPVDLREGIRHLIADMRKRKLI